MKAYLGYLAQLTGITAVLSIILRRLLPSDTLSKVIFMALGIALSNLITWYFWQNLLLSRLFLVFLDVYCVLVFLISVIVSSHKFSSILPGLSLVYFVVSLAFYLMQVTPSILLNTENLLECVSIVVFSIIVVFFIASVFNSFLREEAVKRKLFHIGPIMIAPLINDLNSQVLVLLLTGGFYLFFVLEMVRYKSNSLLYVDLKRSSFTKNMLNIMRRSVDKMKEFNSREPHFWFTHLFLILSLQLAYLIGQTGYFIMSEHCVLCLIAADAAAAIIGKKSGSIRIYQGKSLQGTLAFAVTFFLSYSFVQYLAVWMPPPVIAVLSVLTAVTQLFSGDCDNLATALVFFAGAFISVVYT